MTVAEQYEVCTRFFEQVRRASKRVLLLDYDGTLAPFTADRTRAFPYCEIPGVVSRIMAAQTRVVLISGRSARELLFLSGIHPQPEIWGSHGAERLLSDGSYQLDAPNVEYRSALQSARHLLIAEGFTDRIESKPGAVAVHWRGVGAAQQRVIEAVAQRIGGAMAEEHGLELLPFDGGLELRAPGKTKGDAVRTILAESGQNVAAAYLGDDKTDENAFRAIKGQGLAVLVRPEPRPTSADVWLRPPDELLRFLQDWLQACGTER